MFDLKKIRYNADIVLASFAITRIVGGEFFQTLFAAAAQIEPETLEKLEKLRVHLINEGDLWNEEELKMRFLAFIFDYADFDEPEKTKIFYERVLSAVVEEKELFVKCDCLIAKPFGINTPQTPYFFLQEFKKQKNADDAEGQMLTAMIIAQQLNQIDKPIYGAFIQGKFWTFAALQRKQYFVSQTFDATDKQTLEKILAILRGLKQIILHELS